MSSTYYNPSEYEFKDIYFDKTTKTVVEDDENSYLINSFLNYACEGNMPYNDGSTTLKIFLFELDITPEQITAFLTRKLIEWLSINNFILDIAVECVGIDAPVLFPHQRVMKIAFTIKEMVVEVAKEVF